MPTPEIHATCRRSSTVEPPERAGLRREARAPQRAPWRGSSLRALPAAALLAAALGLPTAGAESGERPGGAAAGEPVVSSSESRTLKEVTDLAERDLAAAIEKLREALTPASSAALDFSLGLLCLRADRYEEAEAALGAALRKMPAWIRAWTQLGRVRLLRSDPSGAAEAFRRSLSGERDSSEVWKLLGYSYFLDGRWLEAETAYRQALVSGGEDREALAGLAKVYLAREAYAEALAAVDGLLSIEPLRSEYWVLAANAHLGAGRPERALVSLECARRLSGLGGDAALTLGDLYYNLQVFGLAARRYEEAFATGTVPPDQMVRCAQALLAAGELEPAEGLLAKVSWAELKDPARAWVLRGQIAEARSDAAAAIDAYEKAAEADPLSGEALLGLGNLYWQAGRHERARAVLERASRIRGKEAKALVLLAQIDVELDRYGDAIRNLQSALDIEPSARIRRYLEEVQAIERALAPSPEARGE